MGIKRRLKTQFIVTTCLDKELDKELDWRHRMHDHNHPEHAAASSPEEALALLNYMLDHNRHHAEELHDLAHCFDEVSGDLIHQAVDKLGESNDLIEQALALIKNSN